MESLETNLIVKPNTLTAARPSEGRVRVVSTRPAIKRPVERPWLVPELTEFAAFELSDDVAEAVWDMGYRQPTEIQQQVIPPFMSGIDIVGQAQTGTGKTAALGIPIAELLDDQSPTLQAI